MARNKGVIRWIGRTKTNNLNQESFLNSTQSDRFHRVKWTWVTVCWTGEAGWGAIHPIGQTADCSHMMTYGLVNQVHSTSPVFQLVAGPGIWPDPGLCWKNVWPCSQVLLWFKNDDSFSGRIMLGYLFSMKRIWNLPFHSLIVKGNGFFCYQ